MRWCDPGELADRFVQQIDVLAIAVSTAAFLYDPVRQRLRLPLQPSNMLSERMQQTHDKYFKLTFAKTRNAVDLLRSVLPAPVIRHLDFDNLKDARETSVRTSALDGEMEQRFKDLLFTIPFTGSDTALYVLLEHKSGPVRLTTFQSSRYAIDTWSKHVGDDKSATRLPFIVPVVVHHGPDGWDQPTDLGDDIEPLPMGVRDALARYRPRWEFLLYDVATESDGELSQRGMNPEATLALWALARAPGNPSITADFGRVHGLMQSVRDAPDGREDLTAFLNYILLVSETSHDLIHAYLTAALGPKAKGAYMTAAEQIRQEARQETHRADLYAVLEARGVSVPDIVRARIDTCDDVEQLATWLRRAVTATSAADVVEGSS